LRRVERAFKAVLLRDHSLSPFQVVIDQPYIKIYRFFSKLVQFMKGEKRLTKKGELVREFEVNVDERGRAAWEGA
jgi:hypothetical protein